MTIRLNNPYIIITSLLLSAALLALYLVQIQMLTQSAYRISEYELSISKLVESNSVLQSQKVQTFSFQALESLAGQLGFEKVDRIGYIKILSTAVAQNQ